MRPNDVPLYLRRRLRARKLQLDSPGWTTAALTAALPRSVVLAGRRISIDAPDEPGVRSAFVEVLLEDGYRLRKRKGLERVLDVGANVGFFALAVRERFPEAVIHSYEPNPRLAGAVVHQTAQVGAVVHHEAVCGASGIVTFADDDQSVSGSVQAHGSAGITVPAVSLGEAVGRLGGVVDLLKLDCEGAEWDILDHPGDWTGVRHVAMEYHVDGPRDGSVAVESVRRLGYTTEHVPLGHGVGLVFGSR